MFLMLSKFLCASSRVFLTRLLPEFVSIICSTDSTALSSELTPTGWCARVVVPNHVFTFLTRATSRCFVSVAPLFALLLAHSGPSVTSTSLSGVNVRVARAATGYEPVPIALTWLSVANPCVLSYPNTWRATVRRSRVGAAAGSCLAASSAGARTSTEARPT